MAMSSPLRAGGSGDLGMARNLSFSNFGTFADFEHGLGGSASHHDASMLQVPSGSCSNAPVSDRVPPHLPVEHAGL